MWQSGMPQAFSCRPTPEVLDFDRCILPHLLAPLQATALGSVPGHGEAKRPVSKAHH